MNNSYLKIAEHYKNCFDKYGDNHLGMDWPNKDDVETRYQVMLDILNNSRKGLDQKYTLLDFGCGTAQMLDYMNKINFASINYVGLDISEKVVELAKTKFPDNTFVACDALLRPDLVPNFDIGILNGIFTEKRELSYDEMWEYFKTLTQLLFQKSRVALSFNVMSANVDWQRDDLFHVSLDELSSYLCTRLTRDFVVRHDYGLYEYTVYLYKDR